MRELVSGYVEYLKTTKNARENTLQSYRRDLLKFVDYAEDAGIASIDEVNSTTINSYILYQDDIVRLLLFLQESHLTLNQLELQAFH